MKKILKSNRGFTLVELIIAMAILAFLMTAVSSLMGSSIFSFKKTKSDIKVQTSAQDTYNKISDSIMQATDIIIIGYYINEGDLNFVNNMETISYSPELKLFVKNDDVKEYVLDNLDLFRESSLTEADVVMFSDIEDGKQICVKELCVYTSAPIDMNQVTGGDPTAETQSISNTFNGTVDVIKREKEVEVKDSAGVVLGTTSVYDRYDSVFNLYTFTDENIYYEKKYRYMDKLDDYINNAASDIDEEYRKRIFNDALCYLNCDSGSDTVNLSGCIAEIDPETGSIGIDLHFNNKNMTYTTNGMMHPRNSYVLIDKK